MATKSSRKLLRLHLGGKGNEGVDHPFVGVSPMTVEGSISIVVLPEMPFCHVVRIVYRDGTVGLLPRVVQDQEAYLDWMRLGLNSVIEVEMWCCQT